MPAKPTVVAMDLEGVFIPEIWIAVAEKTGIEQLRLTTRDIPDYDRLMRGRIAILHEHKLTLGDIQAVIDTVEPLPGALEFISWLRSKLPLVILSDTFYEFAAPLMAKLGHPTLFCNSIEADASNMIVDYHLRQPDGKTRAVTAFQGLGFRVIAAGDSYNDTGMLKQAEAGILFRPPANVIAEFPQFPVVTEYDELKALMSQHAGL
jgi:phosphoserine/homoserine phosphotransferase